MHLPEKNPNKPSTEQGLYRKYEIFRTDNKDKPGAPHEKCMYYVLDMTCDPYAKIALAAYADAVEATHPILAADIRTRCGLNQFFN